MTKKFTQMDDYIAAAPADVRDILKKIRRVAKRSVPAACETISYQLPALKLEKVFFYFAAFQHHIGVYPPVKGDRQLQKELQRYRGVKGNLKFPLSEPIPFTLIGRVAARLAQEYAGK